MERNECCRAAAPRLERAPFERQVVVAVAAEHAGAAIVRPDPLRDLQRDVLFVHARRTAAAVGAGLSRRGLATVPGIHEQRLVVRRQLLCPRRCRHLQGLHVVLTNQLHVRHAADAIARRIAAGDAGFRTRQHALHLGDRQHRSNPCFHHPLQQHRCARNDRGGGRRVAEIVYVLRCTGGGCRHVHALGKAIDA